MSGIARYFKWSALNDGVHWPTRRRDPVEGVRGKAVRCFQRMSEQPRPWLGAGALRCAVDDEALGRIRYGCAACSQLAIEVCFADIQNGLQASQASQTTQA